MNINERLNNMIKIGQLYRQKSKPNWRKNESDYFVVKRLFPNGVEIITGDDINLGVGYEWVNGDCELIREYEDMEHAVNMMHFFERGIE